MKKYLGFILGLGLLFNISWVVSAFEKNYVLAAVLAILGLFSIIIASIESCFKEREKTKQKEIEETEKTKQIKTAEEEHTKRTEIVMAKSTEQVKMISNAILCSSASMPPGASEKRNNNNLVYFDKQMKNKLEDIISKNYLEDETSYTKTILNKSDKTSSEESKNEHDDESDITKTAINFLSQLVNQKGMGTMENNESEL